MTTGSDVVAGPIDAAPSLDVAAIGNGQVAALIDGVGRIVWWCFPRLDGDPVFCRLLAGAEQKGLCDIVLKGQTRVRARYLRNTAILETILEDDAGGAVRVIDFCPRFTRFERMFHPPQLMRRIEPLRGLPRIAIRVRPAFDYGSEAPRISVGSNHIRYVGTGNAIRLTTDGPVAYIDSEATFALQRPITLIFGPDDPFEASVDQVCREHLSRTQSYWMDWVRALGVPYEWQADVIRAAITLKLCSCDETGAIIAALTTSIPEAPDSERNWDYRFCWPRDAYFVIKALNHLGATHSMESYLGYITNIAMDPANELRPVYGIVHEQDLTERVAPGLAGFGGHGPVRVGNQAAEQRQHDTYGSIILGASQMFIDERLPAMGDIALFRRLEALGERAERLVAEPDAGPWEFRGRTRIHTYSASMCWVACDRLARIAERVGLPDRATHWSERARRLRTEILQHAWNPSRRSFVAAFDHDDLDASCLLLCDLGLVAADDPRFRQTVETMERELCHNGFIMRYTAPDDFGAPAVAFLACQFWLIDALERTGAREKARERLEEVLRQRNSFGMLSEDIDPSTRRLWGNLPQTYSMAGIINSAMSLSLPWADAWSNEPPSRNAATTVSGTR